MTREEKIMKRVQEHYDYLVAQGYEVVCLMLQGSQNYDLDEYSPDYVSDVDTKAIVLPSFRDFCYGRSPLSTTIVLENNEHIDVKDIRVMFETIKKMNVSYIELLYTRFKIINEKYKELISPLFEERDIIAYANPCQFVRCVAGMSMEKRKALCHPYPNTMDKIEKYGYDGKQLHHCARLCEFLYRYMTGTPLADCYISQNPAPLMNFKKQLTADGDRILSKMEAVALCDEFDLITMKFKEEFLEKNAEGSDPRASELLFRIQYEILKRRFKEEINED